MGHAYFLTPEGMSERTKIAARFLRRNLTEYESLGSAIGGRMSEFSRKGLKKSGKLTKLPHLCHILKLKCSIIKNDHHEECTFWTKLSKSGFLFSY
jgi:hypothetical protein